MKLNLKSKLAKSLVAVAGCAAILGSMLTVPVAADNKIKPVADPQTQDSWSSIIMSRSTRNVGRIWTDKSVSADASMTLNAGTAAEETVTKTQGADFQIALSALSSTSTMTTQTDVPLDIVMVLDRSGSMSNSLSSGEQIYVPVYAASLSTGTTYYVDPNGTGSYTALSYNRNQGVWRYSSGGSYITVTPKTSAIDDDPTHMQVYNRRNNGISKMQALKDAANSFICATADTNKKILEETGDASKQHYISIASYYGSSDSPNTYSARTNCDWTVNEASLLSAVNGLNASGATFAEDGIAEAQSLLNESRQDPSVKKVVIFFTDGEPNHGSGFWANIAAQTVNTAKTIKDTGALIYTIGVMSTADNTELPPENADGEHTINSGNAFNYYLHAVSSNYPAAAATYNGNGSRSTWILKPGDRAANSNFYKTADSVDELNNIFNEIFDETVNAPAAPTRVTDSGAPQSSGYVTFTDYLGEFMEVKGVDAIVVKGNQYKNQGAVTSAPGQNDTTVQTYTFTDRVTDVSSAYAGKEYSLGDIKIEVHKSSTPGTGDMVRVGIPAALLPLRHYDVDNTGAAPQIEVVEATPIHVIYSVGLKEDVRTAVESGQLESVSGLTAYAQTSAENDGILKFYANRWNSANPYGDAYSTFIPALTNNFYYYQRDTYLYTDEACTQLLTSAPQVNQTYYYAYTYYDFDDGAADPTPQSSLAVVPTDASIGGIKRNETQGDENFGGWYIPRGSAKLALSNGEEFQRTKSSNPTGTSNYYMEPTWFINDQNRTYNYMGNNGLLSYYATGSLAVSKVVQADAALNPNPDAVFAFDVQLTADDPNVILEGEYAYTIATATAQTLSGDADTGVQPQAEEKLKEVDPANFTDGSYKLVIGSDGKGTLYLKANQTATIHAIRDGVTYTITEKSYEYTVDGVKKTTTAQIADGSKLVPLGGFTQTNSSDTNGKIETGTTPMAAFENTYAAQEFHFPSGNTGFAVEKYVRMRTEETPIPWHTDWEFSFTISAARTGAQVPMPESTTITITDEDAHVDNVFSKAFGTITFTEPGTYHYLITEVEPAPGLSGISYSNASFEVEVNIVDNGDGTLSAVVYEEDAQGNKVIVPDKEFQIYQTHNYAGNALADPAAVDAARFINIYDLESVSAAPRAHKYLQNESGANVELWADAFKFSAELNTVLTKYGLYNTEKKAPTFASATNSSTGAVSFHTVPFDTSDVGSTYVYDIREIMPTTPYVPGAEITADTIHPSIQYDKTHYRAYVTVSGGDSDAVTYSARYVTVDPDGKETDFAAPATGLPFTNIFAPEAVSASIQVQKTLTGRSWDQDSFTFTLKPQEGQNFRLTAATVDGKTVYSAVPGDGTSASLTADVTAATQNIGTATFPEIFFNKAGSYYFSVTETIPTATNGIVYDSHTAAVRVDVTVDKDTGIFDIETVYINTAALNADDQAVKNAAAFTNTYDVKPLVIDNLFPVAKQFDRNGDKAYTDEDWLRNDRFAFRMITGNGISPDELIISQATALAQTGIPGATFAHTATYSYVHDAEGNPFYGPYVYYVFERLGTGTQDNREVIPGVDYDTNAYKLMVYTTDKDSNGVSDGVMKIDRIEYYVAENALTGGEDRPSVTLSTLTALDDAGEFVRITDGTNLMNVAGEDHIKRIVFTNTYDAKPVVVSDIHGTKTMVGRAAEAGEFTFTLIGSDSTYLAQENGVIAAKLGTLPEGETGMSLTAVNSAADDGQTASFPFDAITFQQEGTYTFTISETPGSRENVTYDTHVSTVTVTVADNGQGDLTASVVYDNDPNAHHASFTNLYYDKQDAKDVVDGSGRTIDGKPVSAGDILTYTIDWVNTALDINGKPTAGTVTITDSIPAGTTYVADSATTGENITFTPGAGLRWEIAAGAAERGTVSFQVKVDANLTSGADLSNTASVNDAQTNSVTNYVPGKKALKDGVELTNTSDISVGDILTFEVFYKNTEKTAADITITDTLQPGLEYVGMVGTYQQPEDPNANPLTWMIGNVAAGEGGSIAFQAKVTPAAMSVDPTTNTATVKIGENAEVKTNTVEIPEPSTGTLEISKTVEESDSAPAGEFTFKVELDLAGAPLSGTYTYSVKDATGAVTANGSIADEGTLMLAHGETAVIIGLPVNASYAITETELPAGFNLSSKTGDSGIITSGTAKAAFTNAFTPAEFDGNIMVTKQIVDATNGGSVMEVWPQSNYTFRMKMIRGTVNTPMPTEGLNEKGEYIIELSNAQRTAKLPKIQYSVPNTYFYYIEEQMPQDADDRQFAVSYSKATYLLRVKVDENLNVTAEMVPYFNDAGVNVYKGTANFMTDVWAEADKTDNAVFNNEYDLHTLTWSPAVRKNFLHTAAPNLMSAEYPFVFQGELLTEGGPKPSYDQNATPEQITASKQATIYGEGLTSFQSVTFTHEHLEHNPTSENAREQRKSYIYRFEELPGGLTNVTYDEMPCYLVLDVYMKKGTSETDAAGDALAVDGTYYKQVPAGTAGAATLTTDKYGTVSVVEITAPQGGTLAFQFTNTYTPEPAVAAMKVGKTITGRSVWTENDRYTFQLVPVGSAPMPDDAVNGVSTVTLDSTDADHEAAFPAITYSTTGTYNYRITEAAEPVVPGVANDTTICYAQVTVTNDSKTGSLAATVKYGKSVEVLNDAIASFTNTYSVAPVSASIHVQKELTGRAWQDGTDTYTFTLTAEGGAPMPTEANGNTVTVTSENVPYAFGEISLSKPGTYKYTVTETQGNIAGVSYDTAPHSVTVTVTDNLNGTMTAVVDYGEGMENALTITNTYAADATTAVVNVSKTFLRFTDAHNFTFSLTPDSATKLDGVTSVHTIPMPVDAAGTEQSEISIGITDAELKNDDGTFKTEVTKNAAFPAITFTETGIYHYTVKEVIPTPPSNHGVYDRTEYKVTVRVTDNGSGTLRAVVSYADVVGTTTSASFVNVHVTERPDKSVDKAIAGPGEVLTYTIHWVNTTGHDNATITITDTVPTGTTYVTDSAQPAATVSTAAQPVVTWKLTNVAVGESGTVTFQVRIRDDAPDTIRNHAIINNAKTNETATFVPKKTVSDAAPSIGESITYTIFYKNTESEAATVTITDTLDPKLDFVSAAVGIHAGTVRNENGTVTWTLHEVPAGQGGTVTLVAKLNEKALVAEGTAPGMIENVAVVNGHKTNVVKISEVEGSGKLNISKTVETSNAPEAVFTFRVKISANGSPLTGTYNYTVGDAAKTITFDGENGGTLTLKAGETADITGLPTGADYEVQEIDLPAGFAQSKPFGWVQGVQTFNATGTITESGTNAAFTNSFTPTTAQIFVEKIISGRDWQDTRTDSYTFKLEPVTEGAPMPAADTVTVDREDTKTTDGYKNAFGAISYSKAGTYQYQITETEGSVPGIAYSKDTCLVSVTITDTDGEFGQTVTYGKTADAMTDSIATFTNAYAADNTTAEIFVEKVIDGRGWKNEESFGFLLEPVASNGLNKEEVPMPDGDWGNEKELSIGSADAEKTKSFGTITYEKPGTYSYTVKEVPGFTAVDGAYVKDGLTYDTTVYQVQVIVTDNQNGTMSTQVQYRAADTDNWTDVTKAAPLTITNTYAAAAADGVDIRVGKTFKNFPTSGDYSFTFELQAKNNAPMPENSTVTITGNGYTEGSTAAFGTNTIVESFGKVSYDQKGTYEYTILEIKPEGSDPNIYYDQTVMKVKVVVDDNESGQLTAAVSYNDNAEVSQAAFVNLYSDGSQPTKTVENNTQTNVDDGKLASPGDLLTYTINWVNKTGLDGATVVITDKIPEGTTLHSKGDDAQQNGTTLTWTISNAAAGETGSVSFTVMVNDDAAGDIHNQAKIGNEPTVSVHTYVPKKIVSEVKPNIGEEITYTIAYKNTERTTASVTIEDALDARLTYIRAEVGVHAGTVEYTNGTVTWFLPNVPAGEEGVVTLKAKLNEKALIAMSADPADIPNFALVNGVSTNVVKIPEVRKGLPLEISKSVVADDGADLREGYEDHEFTFQVSLSHGLTFSSYKIAGYDTPIDAADNKIVLKHGQTAVIENLPQGTAYTITETDLPTGYTGEAAKSGTITDSVSTVAFVNTYKPVGATVTLNAMKLLDNKENLAVALPTFSFGVYDNAQCEGEPVATGSFTPNASMNQWDGTWLGGVAFTEITIRAAGEYTYYIKETVNADAQHIDFDLNVYKAVVTATDTNGTLTTTVAYYDAEGNALAGAPTFQNKYLPGYTIGSFILEAQKKLNVAAGSQRSLIPGEFTFGLYKVDAQNKEELIAYLTNDAEGNIVYNTPVAISNDMLEDLDTVQEEYTLNVTENNAPVTYVQIDDTAIPLTLEELALVEEGAGIHLKLLVQNAYVSPEVQAVVNGLTNGIPEQYFSISMTKTIGESETNVESLLESMKLTFQLGEHSGSYSVAKIVSGSAVLLPDLDGDGNNTVTIETDSFGTFALIRNVQEEEPEETQPEETQPEETQPVESQPEETQPEETQPVESQPEETQPEETQPEETQPEETEPEETQPEETQPVESQPEETQPEETQPEETQPEETQPEETQPEETQSEETQPEESKPEESQPEENLDGQDLGDDEAVENSETEPEDEETLGDVIMAAFRAQPYRIFHLSNTEENGKSGAPAASQPARTNALTASLFRRTRNTESGEDSTLHGAQIQVTAAGNFTYILREMIPSNEDGTAVDNGITYDRSEYRIDVQVVLDKDETGNSILVCKPAYYKVKDAQGNAMTPAEVAEVTFANGYEAKPVTGSVTVNGAKELIGRDLEAGEFTFQIKNNETGEIITAQNTVNQENKKTGSFSLTAPYTFRSVGTYTFTVSEVTGSLPYVTYDTKEFEIKVVVTDDGNGKLAAEVVSTEAVSFTNTYNKPDPKPTGDITISGSKILTGRDLVDGEFSFQLMDGETVVATTTNDANGSFRFDLGSFTEEGTHTYTITEVQGDLPGVVYSTQRFTVVVEITEDDNLNLAADVTYPDGEPVFRNTFTAKPASLTLTGKKTLIGRWLSESEFDFEVRDYYSGELLATGKNAKDGTIAFTALTFDEAKTYTLSVKEVKGSQPGIRYDDTVYTIIVNVTLGSDGNLKAEAIYPDGGLNFKNVYKPVIHYNPDNSNPKTGDNIQTLLFICFSSAASLAVLLLPRKRQRRG